MTLPLHWRIVGTLARAAGYAAARLRGALRSADGKLHPTRGWRSVEAGGVRLLLPPGWGEPEAGPDGGVVIHNRPRHARIDGDAVWYASAVEIHIHRGGRVHHGGDAMTTTSRTLGSGSERATVSLSVANGAAPRLRRIAARVLAAAAPAPRGGARLAPVAAAPVPPLAHPRVAMVPAAPSSGKNSRSGEGRGERE